MDKDETDDEVKPTFRIRFTISNNSNLNTGDSPNIYNYCDESRCNDQSFYQDQKETQPCSHQVVRERKEAKSSVDFHEQEQRIISTTKLFKFIQPQNHKSSLIVNLSSQQQDDSSNKNDTHHLFVSPDLNHFTPASPPSPSDSTICSATGGLFNTNAPQLSFAPNHHHPSLSPDSDNNDEFTLDSTMSQGCNFINSLMSASRRRSASVTPPVPTSNVSGNTTLSKSPGSSAASSNRRASSSNNLTISSPTSPLTNKSSCYNHLAVCLSNETICSSGEPTQTNKSADVANNDAYIQHSQLNSQQNPMQPLQIDIDDDESNSELSTHQQLGDIVSPTESLEQIRKSINHYQYPMSGGHPISLEEILQIDIDNLRLEDECKNLESQVQYWEQKVDDLERKRFVDEVPRTLVENMLKQRKRLRDLEFQIYKVNLESSDEMSDQQSGQLMLSPSPNESPPNNHYLSHNANNMDHNLEAQLYSMHDDEVVVGQAAIEYCKGLSVKGAGKFGSHIKPGQENTADILDAIPPSGSLQHRQYLSKASTGTDSSEYSQMPTYDQHRHQLPLASVVQVSTPREDLGSSAGNKLKADKHLDRFHCNQSSRNHQGHHRRRDNQQQAVYMQFDAAEQAASVRASHHPSSRHRSSPIRPNHFKSDFRSPHAIVSQDSSSTASSGSPH